MLEHDFRLGGPGLIMVVFFFLLKKCETLKSPGSLTGNTSALVLKSCDTLKSQQTQLLFLGKILNENIVPFGSCSPEIELTSELGHRERRQSSCRDTEDFHTETVK